jgi:pimeloyl-ACP methyl ester carboxylesterase
MNARLPGKVVAFSLLLLTSAAMASEPDFARESRLADEIVDAILDGDPEWLQADGREFLGIYTEADEARAAVLILHGRGFHPDWVDAINPLRVGLAERGYTTLSLQMPVLEKEAKYYDYIPIFHHSHRRIEAGIGFLREQGHEKVVLLAHSCGAHMALDWIRAKNDNSIDAFVGLGMGATDYQQPMHQPFPLDWMQVPILDLYGANDYPAVIRLAPGRRQMIEKAGHPDSRQMMLPDANHYFTNQGGPLVAAVANWLDKLQ